MATAAICKWLRPAGHCRKTHQLVHEPAARAAGVQVVKRFSGGGTVVVDGDTQFVTLIINQPDLAGVPAQPRTIMQACACPLQACLSGARRRC